MRASKDPIEDAPRNKARRILNSRRIEKDSLNVRSNEIETETRHKLSKKTPKFDHKLLSRNKNKLSDLSELKQLSAALAHSELTLEKEKEIWKKKEKENWKKKEKENWKKNDTENWKKNGTENWKKNDSRESNKTEILREQKDEVTKKPYHHDKKKPSKSSQRPSAAFLDEEEVLYNILKSDEDGCGFRLVCELAGTDPDELTPDQLEILRFVQEGDPVLPGTGGLSPTSPLLVPYQDASRLGATGLSCQRLYDACQLTMSQLLQAISG